VTQPVVTQPVVTQPVVTTPVAPAPPLPTPDAQPKVIRLKNGHVAALAGIIAFILIACGVAGAMGAPKPKPAGELVGQLPFGPDGGTMTFDDGKGEIEVPEGALDGEEVIEVRRTVIRERVRAAAPTGQALVFPPGALVMYTFGPITIVLNRPVVITLQLPVLNQAGLIFVNVNGQIRFIPGALAGRTITVQLTTFNLAQPGAVVGV
ncbi:MAG: hypothetical protein WD826_07770, partial [Actinomycetota bacterium]